jgi:predicted enzyme related to lactoylglutathione lyase
VRVLSRIAGGGVNAVQAGYAGVVFEETTGEVRDRLINRGYVERPEDADRRGESVVLTDRGSAAVAAVRAAVDDVDGRLLDAIGPAEAYRMRQALAVLCAIGDGCPERLEMPEEPPATGSGTLSYLELPTDDVERSAAFYRVVFGWKVRNLSDGRRTFTDSAGGVGGTWVVGRRPEAHPSMVVSITVGDIAATLAAITSMGGHVLDAVGHDTSALTARFSDPSGNVLGLRQETPASEL